MKKLLLALTVISALLATACNKDRVCRCVPTDIENPTNIDATLITLDHGMSCMSITRLGFERQMDGTLQRSLVEVSCSDNSEEEE